MEELKLMEIVKTYDGTRAYRKNCRYIKGKYYIINEQCFLVNGYWYRIDSGKIAFDHEKSKWVLFSHTHLLEGIIGFDNNYPTTGYFSPNVSKNTTLFINGNFVPVIDEKLVLEKPNICIEGVNGNYYLKNSTFIPSEFTTKIRIRREDFYSFPYNYGSEPLIPTFKRDFDENFIGEPLLSDAYKYLDNYTFGVEFETDKGAIPERRLINNGLIACRDGSINGFEYTTIPLYGETGIQAIKKTCDLLKRYCSCTANESLHIHIGAYPKTTRSIAALYRLGLLVQKEIYELFPYYYKDTGKFKRKGYCNPLYSVGKDCNTPKDIMNNIYYYLSGGQNFNKFPIGNHPMDRSGQHKWEISPRYHYMNLIPIIWGNRGTVEFRCHTPTINANKVINWLFILVAILKYSKKNINNLTKVTFNELEPISLASIVELTYPKKISNILIKYMEDRKKHYMLKNDATGESEILSEENSVDLIKTIPFI